MASYPKNFKLRPNQIRALAPGHGGCIASDIITVDGHPVSLMYRQAPNHPSDSGWCFTTGLEPQAYLDDPGKLAIYDVNTIANYDPDIIPMLDAPVGAAFERNRETGEFGPIDFEPED